MYDQIEEVIEEVIDAAVKAARAEAKKQGIVVKGGDLKVVINMAFRSEAEKRWLAFGSKTPAPCPGILRGSLAQSAEEAGWGR